MELVALTAAAVAVLGAPALAAVSWRRSLDERAAAADSVELVAVAYGGIAVAALSTWIVAELAGMSWRSALLAVLAGSLALLSPALMRLVRRPGVADGTIDEDALTGQYDGRVVPDAVVEKQPVWRLLAPTANPHFRVLALAGGLFALLVWMPFLDYGLQRADGIHRMAMTDWYKHLITTTALTAADTFPPPNPFLHLIDAAPYYYGFHLVAASISRLAAALTGGTAEQTVYAALLSLTLVTAVATPFVVYTAARTIASGKGADLGDATRVPLLAALGATFLAGFDLIPLTLDALVNLAGGAARAGGLAALRAVVPSTHLDYWIHHNERQFSAPYLTTLWAPQHMAAVLVALLALHLVIQRRLRAERTGSAGVLGASWLLPALLLAGLPALSAYVALGLAMAVAGALLIESVRRRCLLWHTRAWQQWLLPAAIAVLLALPVGAVLTGGDSGGLTVQVSAAGGWSNGALFTALFGPGWLSGVVDSLAVYLVELGIVGVLAAVEIRRLARKKRLSSHQQHVVWMVLSLLVLLVFIRPPAGMPNNLYARPMVLVWCLLAPFAAMRFVRLFGLVTRVGSAAAGDRPATSRAHRSASVGNARWVIAGVLLCLLANGYALLGTMLEGALFWATPVSTVEAARWVSANAPAGAVVAVAPDDWVSGLGYWLRRPPALADERHALLFGANGEQYAHVAAELRRARASADPAVAAAALRTVGGSLLLLARANGEPAWLRADCFATPFENDEWIVAAPLAGQGCDRR